MCYLFDSLQENFLLNQGDAIALMIPVFTPYIEIPELRRYQFDVTEISADQMTPDGLHTWQYKDEDIDKLKDPRIKALFITNQVIRPVTHLAGDYRTYHQHCEE